MVEIVADDRVRAGRIGERGEQRRDAAESAGAARLQSTRIDGIDGGVVVVRGADQIGEDANTVLAEPAERFADENDGLAPLPQRAEVHDRAFQSGRRHLGADALDVLSVAEMRLFDGAAGRNVEAAAAAQVVDLVGQLAAIAGEAQRADRRELIHQRHEIRRAERFEHEVRELLARAHRAAELIDVVLVPENHEHPHVVSRGFGGGMLGRTNRQREVVGRLTVGVDQLERRDRLQFAVLAQLEVVLRETADRLAVPVHHADVDANDVSAGAESRRARLLLLSGLLRAQGDSEQTHYPHARKRGAARHGG
jgi:hypothetical protein